MNALIRKQNDRNQCRGLPKSLRSQRRRHDPWLVFNMASFTFQDQPLHGFSRLVSRENLWR